MCKLFETKNYDLLTAKQASTFYEWSLHNLSRAIKIARYVIGDDAIIAVRINTNGNGINNNYKVNNRASAGGLLDEK